jgi:hypothetical protein
MICSLRRGFILVWVAMSALTTLACAAIPPRINAEAKARVQQSVARSYVPEPQLTVRWVESGYGGGGLLGAVINSAVASSRKKDADALAQRLRTQAKDVDFRAQYRSALEPALKEVAWLRFQGLVPDDRPLPLPEVNDEDVRAHGLLTVGTNYFLSPDCAVLIVQSEIAFYEQGHSSRAASVRVRYQSEEIGNVEGDEAVALWERDSAAAYRTVLNEAVYESSRMARLALEYMGGAGYPGNVVHIRARLDHARGDFGIKDDAVGLDGTVVEENDRRLILLAERTVYSLPKTAIESSGQQARGRAGNVSMVTSQLARGLGHGY